MSIDKSLKQHYETQAGVKNYLGKQKMVKAPKYWLSKPGHVKAKLAYITDEEEQILIDKNLYGSLRGRPNKGPAGLPSLQGGDFGAGGGGGSSGGGGGEGRPHGGWSAPAPTVTQTAAMEDIGARDTIAGLTPGPSPHGDREANIKEQAKLNIQQMIAKQQEEKFGPLADPTKFGEIAEKDLRTQKEKDEDWERAQDWGKIQDLSKKGYGFEEIQDALEKGLLSKTDPQSLKTNLPNLRNWVPKTGLEKSLINSLMPTMTKGGIKDQLGKAAFNLGAKKLGLGSLLSVVNPALFFASFIPGLKGKAPKSAYDLAKNLTANIQTKGLKTQWNEKSDWSKVKPSKDPDERGDGLAQKVASGKDVISEGIKKFTLTEDQRKEAMKRRGIVQNILNQGSYQGNELTNQQRNQLTNYISQIDQYLVPVEMAAYGGRIDKPLTGRSRDI